MSGGGGGDFSQIEPTNSDVLQAELLDINRQILIEMQRIRMHLETITDNTITREDVER